MRGLELSLLSMQQLLEAKSGLSRRILGRRRVENPGRVLRVQCLSKEIRQRSLVSKLYWIEVIWTHCRAESGTALWG